MKTLVPLLAAALSGFLGTSHAAEAPDRAPDFSGKFMISYMPIYCVRAPCPPGSFSITAEGRSLGTTSAVIHVSEPAEPAQGGGRPGESTAVEGDLWIDAEARTAYIRPVRILSGAWKTEFPDPSPDAGEGKAPIVLVVVNKTRDVVRGIYVSPARDDHWGTEQLKDNLSINQRVSIELPTADCLYDVRILLANRPSEEIRRQNVCEAPVLLADRSGEIIERIR